MTFSMYSIRRGRLNQYALGMWLHRNPRAEAQSMNGAEGQGCTRSVLPLEMICSQSASLLHETATTVVNAHFSSFPTTATCFMLCSSKVPA
jgi:hypothetical protein